MREPTPESIDPPLHRYADGFRRMWAIPVVAGLVFGVIGAVVGSSGSSSEEVVATAALSVSNPASLSGEQLPGVMLPVPVLATEAERAESADVVGDLDSDDVSLSAAADNSVLVVRLSVTGPNPMATQVLTDWINSFRSDRAARLSDQLAALKASLTNPEAGDDPTASEQLSALQVESVNISIEAIENSADAGVVLIDSDTSSAGSSGLTLGILLGFLGAALGCAAVLFLTFRDHRIHSAAELAGAGIEPILGAVTPDGAGAAAAIVATAARDAHRQSRTVVIAGVDGTAASGVSAFAASTATTGIASSPTIEVAGFSAVEVDALAESGKVTLLTVPDLSGCPEVLTMQDALVVLCVEVGATDIRAAAIAHANLHNAGLEVLGVVMTGVNASRTIATMSV